MESLVDIFKNTFEYKNGFLYWKITKGTRAIKGSKAGKLRKDGYYDVGLNGKYYLVHRIIFALHYGYLPDLIDHIDRNRSNNQIENLRVCNYSMNNWNSAIPKNNTTGVKGVRITKNGKYEARLAKNGITYQIGTFKTIEEAESAIKSFREKEHGIYSCHE